MSTSDDLIKRLENAQGPDRELDLAIHIAAVRCDPTAQYYPNGNCLSYYEHHPEVPGGANEFLTEELPHYTASIDAALTLYVTIPARVPSDPRVVCIEALKQRQANAPTCRKPRGEDDG